MPRIPRRSSGPDEGPAPQEQRTDGEGAPSTEPPTQQLSSGDPLASAAAPVPPASGDIPAEQPTVAAPALDPATTVAEPAGQATGETVVQPAIDAGTAAPATTGEPVVVPAEGAAPVGATALEPEGEQAPLDARPRFRERTRMRRRLRYLRRLRELAFRDLGGLVFDLHRFGRDRNDLVAAKLEALAHIDRELRALEEALDDRREFTDLREAGIAACPRCGTLHDTDANFCPGCGTSLRTTVVRDAAPVTVTPADETPAPDPQQPSTTPP